MDKRAALKAAAVIEALKIAMTHCYYQRLWFSRMMEQHPQERPYASGIICKCDRMKKAIRRELEVWEHPQLTLF